jgi:hypothetical protein
MNDVFEEAAATILGAFDYLSEAERSELATELAAQPSFLKVIGQALSWNLAGSHHLAHRLQQAIAPAIPGWDGTGKQPRPCPREIPSLINQLGTEEPWHTVKLGLQKALDSRNTVDRRDPRIASVECG